MSGWIKLHRQFTKWEWFTDVNTCHLFQYLLLEANHQESKWRGQVIMRGQLLTGRAKMAKNVGLSPQQVRTSLHKLKSTSDITIKSYNKYSIITITNWSKYQDINQQVTSEDADKQPTSNQQATTSKNIKNIKNIKKEREAHTNFKNLLLEKEFLKIANEEGLFGNIAINCWNKWKALREGSPPDDLFGNWKVWVLNEKKPLTAESADKLSPEETKIQLLGIANWKRKMKKSLEGHEHRLITDWEAQNGSVWWCNFQEFKKGKI